MPIPSGMSSSGLTGRFLASAYASRAETPKATPHKDLLEISSEARRVPSAKSVWQVLNETGYPPGFPEDIQSKIQAVEQELGPMDLGVISLRVALIMVPMAESAYARGTLQSDGPDAEVFQRGGFDMQKHIHRMIEDTQAQLGRGENVALNNRVLALLKQLKR